MKPKGFDFTKLKDDLRDLAKCSDSSEQHTLLDFMADVVDNIEYDIKAGHPEPGEIPEILRDHMISCLDQFEDHAATLKKYLKERIQ